MIKLKISFKGYALNAELYETSTAKEIYKILPFSSKVTMWGKELYFTIPVNCDLDAKAREVVSVGELGFWPTGNAFCIFWGPTPLSTDENPRAVSPINVFGKVLDEIDALNKISNDDEIRIEAIEEN